jgi:hypothetical protein
MSTRTTKGSILLTCIIGVLLAGCGGQATRNERLSRCQEELAELKEVMQVQLRKARLIAAENKKLLDELDAQGRQIVELKRNHAKELADQKEQLDKCQTERDSLREKVKGQIETQVDEVLETVMNQNAQLRLQVQQLQAELDALKSKPDTN